MGHSHNGGGGSEQYLVPHRSKCAALLEYWTAFRRYPSQMVRPIDQKQSCLPARLREAIRQAQVGNHNILLWTPVSLSRV